MKFTVTIQPPKRPPDGHGSANLPPLSSDLEVVKITLPVDPDETFADVWKHIKERYEKNYSARRRIPGTDLTKLQDLEGGDITLSDKVGSMYAPDAPHAQLQLVVQLEAIDRECTIPTWSGLLPPGFQKRKWKDVPEEEQTLCKRLRLQEQRYGSAVDQLHPDRPVMSHEANDSSMTEVGIADQENASRIDVDGFRMPAIPTTAAQRSERQRRISGNTSTPFSRTEQSRPDNHHFAKNDSRQPQRASSLAALRARHENSSPQSIRVHSKNADTEISLANRESPAQPSASIGSHRSHVAPTRTRSPPISSDLRPAAATTETPNGLLILSLTDEVISVDEVPPSGQSRTKPTQSKTLFHSGSRTSRFESHIAVDDPILDDDDVPLSAELSGGASRNASGTTHRHSVDSNELSRSQTTDSIIRTNSRSRSSPLARVSHRTHRSAFERLRDSETDKLPNSSQTSTSKSPWTPQEDRMVINGLRLGFGPTDTLNRIFPPDSSKSLNAIKHRRNTLVRSGAAKNLENNDGNDGLETSSNADVVVHMSQPYQRQDKKWTPDEVSILSNAIAEGWDPSEIRSEYFNYRSYESVKKKMQITKINVLIAERQEDTFPKDDPHLPDWSDENALKLRRVYRDELELSKVHKRWFSSWPLEEIKKKLLAYQDQMNLLNTQAEKVDDQGDHSDQINIVDDEIPMSSVHVDSHQHSQSSDASIVIGDSHPETIPGSLSSHPRVMIPTEEQVQVVRGQLKKVSGTGGQMHLNWRRDKGKQPIRPNREKRVELDADWRQSRSREAPLVELAGEKAASGSSSDYGEDVEDSYLDPYSQAATKRSEFATSPKGGRAKERGTESDASLLRDSRVRSTSVTRVNGRSSTGASLPQRAGPSAISHGTGLHSDPSSHGNAGLQLSREFESSVPPAPPLTPDPQTPRGQLVEVTRPEEQSTTTLNGYENAHHDDTVEPNFVYISAHDTSSSPYYDAESPQVEKQVIQNDISPRKGKSSRHETERSAISNLGRTERINESHQSENPTNTVCQASTSTSASVNQPDEVPSPLAKNTQNRRLWIARPSQYDLQPANPSTNEVIPSKFPQKRPLKQSVESSKNAIAAASSGKLPQVTNGDVFSVRHSRAKTKNYQQIRQRAAPVALEKQDSAESYSDPKPNRDLSEAADIGSKSDVHTNTGLSSSFDNADISAEVRPYSPRGTDPPKTHEVEHGPKKGDLIRSEKDKQRWAISKMLAQQPGRPDTAEENYEDIKLDELTANAALRGDEEEVARLKNRRSRLDGERRAAKGLAPVKHRDPLSISGLTFISNGEMELADEEVIREDNFSAEESTRSNAHGSRADDEVSVGSGHSEESSETTSSGSTSDGAAFELEHSIGTPRFEQVDLDLNDTTPTQAANAVEKNPVQKLSDAEPSGASSSSESTDDGSSDSSSSEDDGPVQKAPKSQSLSEGKQKAIAAESEVERNANQRSSTSSNATVTQAVSELSREIEAREVLTEREIECKAKTKRSGRRSRNSITRRESASENATSSYGSSIGDSAVLRGNNRVSSPTQSTFPIEILKGEPSLTAHSYKAINRVNWNSTPQARYAGPSKAPNSDTTSVQNNTISIFNRGTSASRKYQSNLVRRAPHIPKAPEPRSAPKLAPINVLLDPDNDEDSSSDSASN